MLLPQTYQTRNKMVKNSKYLITLTLLVWLHCGLIAQMINNKFSPIERDLEISRVTLENFLKRWEGKPLMNKIKKVEAEYQKDYGVKFTIEAPHAEILMINQGGRFHEGDEEIMETFYSEEILELQQQRLDTALNKFIVDFKAYLPTINPNQVLEFKINVGADEEKEAKVKLINSYEIHRQWIIKDLESLKKEEISQEEFIKRVKRKDNK